MERFSKIISMAINERYSDVHMTGSHPLSVRKNGKMQMHPDIVYRPQDMDALVRKLLTEEQLDVLRKKQSFDFAVSVSGTRLRINVYTTTRGLSMAIRVLPGTVPNLDNLNLHPSLHDISKLDAGLILICGATGSGKTTTIAAVIDEINMNRNLHIIMIENPIEYRHQSKRSYIEQRELGTHVPSFEQGLVDILREDPDVIVIGELREAEVMRHALNAAESGHLVIATLHATNAEEAVYRLVNSFAIESQEAVRAQIASTIAWISVQNLMYVKQLGSRVPVLSIMRGTPSVKALIRDAKLHQLENAIQTGKEDGMMSTSRYLEYLDNKRTFIPAAEIFAPSKELVREDVYVSSIYKDTPSLPARPAYSADADIYAVPAQKAKKPIIIQPGIEDESDGMLTIDEEYSIQELVIEMEKGSK